MSGTFKPYEAWPSSQQVNAKGGSNASKRNRIYLDIATVKKRKGQPCVNRPNWHIMVNFLTDPNEILRFLYDEEWNGMEW